MAAATLLEMHRAGTRECHEKQEKETQRHGVRREEEKMGEFLGRCRGERAAELSSCAAAKDLG
jgi:hypothetical protein